MLINETQLNSYKVQRNTLIGRRPKRRHRNSRRKQQRAEPVANLKRQNAGDTDISQEYFYKAPRNVKSAHFYAYFPNEEAKQKNAIKK